MRYPQAALERGQMAALGPVGLGLDTGLSFSLVGHVREATWVGIGLRALAVVRPAVVRARED